MGRINHFVDDGTVSLAEVRHLILDEADRMMETGGFYEDITRLMTNPNLRPKEERQTRMFR